MPRLLVLSHTPSPTVTRLSDAVVAGARDPAIQGVEVIERRPLEADPEIMLGVQGVIFGTTENFGYMSGALKDFFDRAYYPSLDKVNGLPYALFVKAGNDGTGTIAAVQKICTGLRLRQVQAPLLMVGSMRDDWIAPCEELGMTLAAGLEAGIY